MTVEEMINVLKTMPQDANVVLVNSDEGYAILDAMIVLSNSAEEVNQYQIAYGDGDEHDLSETPVLAVGLQVGITF